MFSIDLKTFTKYVVYFLIIYIIIHITTQKKLKQREIVTVSAVIVSIFVVFDMLNVFKTQQNMLYITQPKQEDEQEMEARPKHRQHHRHHMQHSSTQMMEGGAEATAEISEVVGMPDAGIDGCEMIVN